MTAAEILAKPYHRVFIPDAKTGTITAYIEEFPGCVSQSRSMSVLEAWHSLTEVARVWIEISIQMGNPIPEPKEKL